MNTQVSRRSGFQPRDADDNGGAQSRLEAAPTARRNMEVIARRLATLMFLATLLNTAALAGDGEYVMNFDLNMLSPNGDFRYHIQFQGIHLSSGEPVHGNDLGEYDYFLTVSKAESGNAKLTIEFYEYESRRKTSDVISEIVAEVDVVLGAPARFEGKSDTFGVDLAFSINQE